MPTLTGSCHCGAIRVALQTDKRPEEIKPGRCDCSFCRRHGARTTGVRGASLELSFAEADVSRYRMGYGITDYLVCRNCGTYVAATMEDEGRLLAVVNVNALDARDSFNPAPPLYHYDAENEAGRRARRRKFWMPATVIAR